MPALSTGLRSPFQATGRSPFAPAALSLTQRALSILKRPGIEAHVYLPGIGTLSGLAAANFLLSDGSTGNTTVDGVTGLVLDAMGSETQLFNAVGVTTAGPSLTGLNASLNTTAGKTYKVTYTVTALVGQLSSVAGGTSGLAQAINWTGTYSEMLVAVTTGFTNCGLITRGIGVTSVTGSVTVTEVTGIHATQPTTMAKPRLERGVRNLLTWSSDLSNAAWTKTGSSFSGGKLQEDASVSGHTAAQAFTPTAGTTYTAAIALKAAERGFALFGINGGGVAAAFASVNLSTGAMSVATGSPLNLTSVYTSDGYWLVTASIAAVSTASMPVDVRVSTDGVWANRVYQGVAGSGVEFSGTALFQGTLTAQQILAEGGIPLTTTAAASNPNAGKYSWAFDGNDSLALGSVPFQIADDFFVIAGCVSTAATASKVFSIRGATANPLIELSHGIAGTYTYQMRDDAGTLLARNTAATYLNTTVVISGRQVGLSCDFRLNGSQQSTKFTNVLGTTSLTSAAIGTAPLQSSSWLTGSTGPIISGKGALTDSEMLTLERLVTSLTPNGPTF